MTDVAAARALLSAHDPLSQQHGELDDHAIEQIWQDLTRRVEVGTRPSVRGPVRHDPRTVRSAVASIVVLALVAVGVLDDADFLVGAVRAARWILVGPPGDEQPGHGTFARCAVAAPRLVEDGG